MINTFGLSFDEYLEKMSEVDAMIIDPPWNFDNKSPKLTVTTQFKIWDDNKKNLEFIFKNIKTNCVFVYVTASFLPIFFEINLYRFSYKTILTWIKLTKSKEIFNGAGFWFKNSCEYLLMFTTKDARPLHSNIQTVIFEETKKSAQTQKPKLFESRLINNLYDAGYKKICYLFSGSFTNYDIPPGVTLDLIDICFEGVKR